MKRFLLFMGEHYYPEGGWHDFMGSFETLEDAKSAALKSNWEWVQVVDIEENDIVFVENNRRM